MFLDETSNVRHMTQNCSCYFLETFRVSDRIVKIVNKQLQQYLLCTEPHTVIFTPPQVTPTDKFPSQSPSSPWVMASPTEAVITAYFRNPRTICGRRHSLKRKPKIGNQLYIQLKSWLSSCKVKNKILKVPRKEKALKRSKQPWVQGKCFNGMGKRFD